MSINLNWLQPLAVVTLIALALIHYGPAPTRLLARISDCLHWLLVMLVLNMLACDYGLHVSLSAKSPPGVDGHAATDNLTR